MEFLRLASSRFYRWLTLAVIVLVVGAAVLPRLSGIDEPFVADLNAMQAKQIDIFVSMTQLLTTLATLSAGAAAAVIYNRYKDENVPRPQLARALASWSFSAL